MRNMRNPKQKQTRRNRSGGFVFFTDNAAIPVALQKCRGMYVPAMQRVPRAHAKDLAPARTRESGFASNDGEWTSQRKVGALALPIRLRQRPVGSVNIVYLNRAVTLKEAVRRYLPALQKAASRIEAQLAGTPPASAAS